MANVLADGVLDHRPITGYDTNKLTTFIVWFTWLGMLLFALSLLITQAPNMPIAEDWLMVPALTDNETDIADWLWRQQNEHRVPFPKLVYLGLLKISQGDFRAGMVFNVLIMGIVTAIILRTCYLLREKKYSLADAFIPILLLHVGHGDNFYWSWEITYVLPTALTLILGVLVVQYNSVFTPAKAILAVVCLFLLPLCGANGLIFCAIFTPFILAEGIVQWQSKEPSTKRWVGLLLLASIVLTGLEVIFYFVNYERPPWNPPSPGLMASIATGLKFQTIGLGPGTERYWKPAILFVNLFLIVTLIFMLLRIKINFNRESRRKWGMLLFLGGCLAFALAMGHARAGLVPTYGLPRRYTILAVPALFAAYFIWTLYGQKRLTTYVQFILLVVSIGLLRQNAQKGYAWLKYFNDGTNMTINDIKVGMPPALIAKRNREFLLHWNEKGLTSYIEMLSRAKMGAFQYVKTPVDK
jgi:hypothetical protein